MSERVERKPIEKLRGRGKDYEDDQFLSDVSCSLTRYQDIHHCETFGGSAQAEGLGSTDGYIEADNLYDLTGRSMTLHVEDGRRIDGIITELTRRRGF